VSYDAPYGIRLSPVLRHQSGRDYARTLTITAPAGLIATASGTGGNIAYAEPMSANREDNIWVFDLRAEKTLEPRFFLTSPRRRTEIRKAIYANSKRRMHVADQSGPHLANRRRYSGLRGPSAAVRGHGDCSVADAFGHRPRSFRLPH
jgi:hypothetical protein